MTWVSLSIEGESRVEAISADGADAIVAGNIIIDPLGFDVDLWIGADELNAERIDGSPFSEQVTMESVDAAYFLYEVHDPSSDIPPWVWDDDDEYVPPIVPVQPEQNSGDDDTTTIVACAAAAVVAALIAAYLIIDRKH